MRVAGPETRPNQSGGARDPPVDSGEAEDPPNESGGTRDPPVQADATTGPIIEMASPQEVPSSISTNFMEIGWTEEEMRRL